MISEIKYNGFSATPSDYESLDGDLASVVGLVPEDGALRPIAPPEPLFTLATGQSVVLLHTTSVFTHYIIQDEANNIYWRTLDDSTLYPVANLGGIEIYQITAIGNTIVMLCADGMHYALWKANDYSYTYLGNNIPECPISFGLNGESRHFVDINDEDGEDFLISYDLITGDDIYNEFTEDNKRKITQQVLAKVNKFITKVSTDDERFIYPFFVRYAYRLYDGTLSHHSAPILMIPCTRANPVVVAKNIDDGTASSGTRCDIYAIAAKLDYMPLITTEQRQQLTQWSDIIKSVDIFISAPIYTYDQSGECESFAKKRSVHGYIGYPSYFVGKFKTDVVHDPTWDAHMQKYYQRWDINQLYFHDSSYFSNMGPIVRLPEFDKSNIEAKIKSCSSFYFLTSIKIEDLPSERKDVNIEKGTLQALVAREVMTDDYQSHDTMISKYAFNYNSRLNIANIERRLFEGFDIASMCCYTNGRALFSHESGVLPTSFTEEGSADYIVQIDVQTPTGEKHLTTTSSIPLYVGIDFFYMFYPDTIAKKIRLKQDLVVWNGATATLEPHTMLNGAAYFNGFDLNRFRNSSATILPSDNNVTIPLPNKIYTSEVDNPFYFPLLGINTVGSGEIIGLSSAAKALSEGQFGQFPLYAFTTEGVWALEVSSAGSYIARQPITRDVCISGESITQIDSAVLFVTNRGVMLLSGSQSICISDLLFTQKPFALNKFPHAEDLLTSFAKLSPENVSLIPFAEFIASCRILYDYTHQRITLINPNCAYAYVYSLESKAWGMVASTLKSGVNSYPDALAMNKANSLVNLSSLGNATNIPIFLITRPLKIEPDILKTIDTTIQRGYFKKGSVKTALYGSRNLYDWSFISSSTNHILRGYRGTPYKYFRILLMGALDIEETITGATIQYTTRQTNQPR